VIETELTFFKMQVQGGAVEAAKLGQAHLGEAPEVLNALDVRLMLYELVAAMIHPVMLLVAQVHQAAVAFPAIRRNHAAQRGLTLQIGRQHSAAAIGHDLRINLPVALEQSENGHFLKSCPSPFAPDATPAKITFVNLDLPVQRRFGLAQLGQPTAEMPTVEIDRVAVQAGELGNFSGFHIQTKQTQQHPKLLRRNSGTPKVSVSYCHHWLYTVFAYA
jgi:hypothetical protein